MVYLLYTRTYRNLRPTRFILAGEPFLEFE